MSVMTQLQYSSKTPTDSQSHSFSFASKQRPLDVRQLANSQVRYTEVSRSHSSSSSEAPIRSCIIRCDDCFGPFLERILGFRFVVFRLKFL
jgi:hypothetical protein